MVGEDVLVLLPGEPTEDDFGDIIAGDPVEVVVHDVLFDPGKTDDMLSSTRPDGYESTVTFHFPKTFSERLRGAHIIHGDHVYSVIGDPVPFMAENTPTRWHMAVKAEVTDG